MRSNRKKGRIIAVSVAVVVLLVVLVAVIGTASEDDAAHGSKVVAVLNGQDITAEEVRRMQATVLREYGRWADKEEALEQVIVERLLYWEAERESYVPTVEETEQTMLNLLSRRGLTREAFEEQLGAEALSWQEYLDVYQRHMAISRYLDDKLDVPEVTEEQARRFYEEYKQRVPEDPRTFEEMEEEIYAGAEWFNRQTAAFSLIQELRAKAEIHYR